MVRGPPGSPRTDTLCPYTALSRSERAVGGASGTGAQADIIRAYFGWLAAGNGRADFLTAYAGFLSQYLDLIRSGAAPSSFESASLGNINAFLAYAGRTGRLADLGAQDRVLAQAYLAFLRGGGNPDLFADGFTDLTEAYLDRKSTRLNSSH